MFGQRLQKVYCDHFGNGLNDGFDHIFYPFVKISLLEYFIKYKEKLEQESLLHL